MVKAGECGEPRSSAPTVSIYSGRKPIKGLKSYDCGFHPHAAIQPSESEGVIQFSFLSSKGLQQQNNKQLIQVLLSCIHFIYHR